jgi:tungstate transport system substrate-binding protein
MLKMESVVAFRNQLSVLAGFLLLLPGVVKAQENPSQELRGIFPETCVSSGFANALCTLFESQFKIPVKTLTLCTGDAIHFVKEHVGIEEYDVMIGHDRQQEERFVQDGYAVNLRPVFYSDYILVGPAEDPAKIKGMKSAAKALERIARNKAVFCSRADSSGTYAVEMKIWKLAGIKPKGDWYIKTKTGTPATLIIAARKRAYMVCHWAIYTQMLETIDLVPMVEEKGVLVSTYEIMAMNPERFPKANYVNAMLFIGFLTSRDVQKYIGEFGIEKFHRPLFLPMAVKTSQPQKGK